MLLAERAGRKLERWSNSAPRGMIVQVSPQGGITQNPAYRPALHIIHDAHRSVRVFPGRSGDRQ